MRKINFALISDVMFFAVCAFILSFTAIRFYFKNALTALICALGIAAATGVLSFFILLSRRKRRLDLLIGESEKKSLSLHLSVLGLSSVLSTFKSVLDGTYAVGNCLEDGQNAYFFNFKLSPLSPDDIANVIRTETPKHKRIFCCEASPAALSLADDFSIGVSNIAEIYALLKEGNALPEKYALGNVKKPNFFKRVKKRFNRKLCPPLFFCGLTLLFFSFFTSLPVYYIVFGGLLLILSAVCLLISQPN